MITGLPKSKRHGFNNPCVYSFVVRQRGIEEAREGDFSRENSVHKRKEVWHDQAKFRGLRNDGRDTVRALDKGMLARGVDGAGNGAGRWTSRCSESSGRKAKSSSKPFTSL